MLARLQQSQKFRPDHHQRLARRDILRNEIGGNGSGRVGNVPGVDSEYHWQSFAMTVIGRRLVSPMKPATKPVGRAVVDVGGRAQLQDAAIAHHANAVGEHHRLFEIVRDVYESDADASGAGA